MLPVILPYLGDRRFILDAAAAGFRLRGGMRNAAQPPDSSLLGTSELGISELDTSLLGASELGIDEGWLDDGWLDDGWLDDG